ncbi:outer membrane lipoprotein carrier protein LolA [Kitasatospora sp. NPDC057015]|uniref:LolA family protein n=1 Tax=Kitasatospora sp. NPDC057015 TaxID=3346001 RepID=UPI0036380FEF
MRDETSDGPGESGTAYRSGRRTAVRVLVPVVVAGVAAAGIGLVPALADDGGPKLPALTAEQLVAKALGAETTTLSGTVRISADLGVPAQLLGSVGGLGTGGQGGGAQGFDPSAASPESKLAGLLGGEHTLRVAVDGPDHQRVGLIEKLAEYELVRNGDEAWAWDSASNQAFHLARPQAAERRAPVPGLPAGVPTTPQEAAKQFLALSAGSTSVTADGTTTVAGRKAYRLSVKPTQSGSTLGEVRIAVDAGTGVPLSVLVKAAVGDTVFDAHFQDVSFAKPDPKTFDFTLPKGAKVTEPKAGREGGESKAGEPKGAAGQGDAPGAGVGEDAVNVTGEGWTTVVGVKLPTGTLPAAGTGGPADRLGGQSVQSLAKALGKPVKGGTLISTKVLNALVTEDGRLFAGAVTLPVLQSAAGVR